MTDKILSARWWYWLPAIGILVYALNVIQLADNTPKFDDLNDVFGFFKELALAQSPLQKAGAFFYTNNEHVTLIDHLIYFAQYSFVGEIRFYPLILIGHIIIIATGLLLGNVVNSDRRPFIFAVISLAYINLLYWDSSFKAMTAISNQVVILLSVAAIFSLLRWRKFSVALLLAFLASFSQGNGILVWPLGFLILLTDPYWHQYRVRNSGIWLSTAIFAIAIFQWAHHQYSAPSPMSATSAIALLKQHPALPFLATFAFLGNTVFAKTQAIPAMLLGMSALGILLWHSRQQQRQILLLAIALFLLLSAATASGLRGPATGDASGLLESRYKMYSVAFVLLALTALLEQRQLAYHRAWLATVMFLLSIGIHASGYRQIPEIKQQAARFNESYANWIVDGDFRRQAVFFPPMSDHFLFVAEKLQVFNAMQLVTNASILRPLPSVSWQSCPPTPAPADHCPMTMRHRGNAIAVAIEAAVNANVDTQPAIPANITLCDAQAKAVMAFAIPNISAPQRRWLIPEADIPAGTYRVLFQSAQQAVCETQLIKKPRKVEAEMRTLFGH